MTIVDDMITKKEMLKAISSGKSTKSQRDEYKESSGKDVEHLTKVYEELNAFENEEIVLETKSSKLPDDYYSQIALLSSLKLKQVDKNDLKAVQDVINEDKDYAILVKGSLSNAVRIGLTLKLRKELIHFLELDKIEAEKSNLNTENITKMLMEIQLQLKPVTTQLKEVHTVVTKKPIPIKEKALSTKEKREKTVKDILEQRMLAAIKNS
jgi:hypothetical protein